MESATRMNKATVSCMTMGFHCALSNWNCPTRKSCWMHNGVNYYSESTVGRCNTSGELQNHLDTWCKNLGTDDDVVINGEHAACNDNRFARHDGQVWACWTDVVSDTNSYSCVSDDKRMVKCGSRGAGG